MPDWKVGDPVVIERSQPHHRHGQPYEPQLDYGTVTKVVRKYFTVEVEGSRWHDAMEFAIADGLQRAKDPNYPQHYTDQAYTPQEWETEKYRRDLRAKIDEQHGYEWAQKSRGWSTGFQVELLDLLDRVKADREIKDLDRE